MVQGGLPTTLTEVEGSRDRYSRTAMLFSILQHLCYQLSRMKAGLSWATHKVRRLSRQSRPLGVGTLEPHALLYLAAPPSLSRMRLGEKTSKYDVFSITRRNSSGAARIPHPPVQDTLADHLYVTTSTTTEASAIRAHNLSEDGGNTMRLY